MKKFKKLLSVILAVVMALSCLTVIGSAYQSYEDPGEYFYDSNDNPRSYLYTDEQRFSFLADMINDLLASANINVEQNIVIATIRLDARSLDSLFDSLEGLSGWVSFLGGLMGDIGDLELDLLMDGDLSVNKAGGPQEIFETLVEFLGVNANQIGDILERGSLDLGLIGNFVDVSAVGDILGDLPSMIGGLIYGIGKRQISNGIGNDPKYPNSVVWEEWDATVNGTKPNFDTMVQNLLYKLLLEPNNITNATKAEHNEIITNPEKFGATAEMLHTETVDWDGNPIVDEDGNPANWWYIYGTQKADGTWAFTKQSTTTDESDKNYVAHWDENSALIKGVAADELREILNLSSGDDLYTMLEKAIPWAYDAFAGHNLDAQLRATLMQFCGAFNNASTVDDATKEVLKAKVDAYKEIEEAADGDKKALRDAFKAEVGAAGNVNFMYIDLEGKDINDKTSDSLYYVVEWGGGYEYYHVERGDVSPFYDLIDWEYQAPMWSEIASAAGLEAGKSILLHINDIVGTILKTAVPSLEWTAGTADRALEGNLVNLIKLVITTDTVKLFGSEFELPADFDSYGLEQCLVMIAGVLLDDLMPQLIVPEDASSIEEVGAYALREFMAEIMPDLGAGWDAKIDAAKALSGLAREDAFLDVVLNMGVSTGAYYLKNLIGLGTVTNGANVTSVEAVPMGAAYSWQDILNYIIDWVVEVWVPDIGANIKAKYPSAWAATDASEAGNPLLKLSAALSMLLPDVARLLGADVDGYALNLQHVYDDLRLAFNGNFSELAKGLSRKDASANTAGTMTLMKALANVLTNLFGGILGFDNAGRWSELKGVMDAAAASATPLTTLLGSYGSNVALAKLVRPLLACLSDVAVDVFLYDAITIVTSFLGGLTTTLTNSGVVVEGVESAYTGATSFTIDYTFSMTTTGVRTYFNNGRYKTTAGAIAGLQSGFDGDYKLKFIDAQVVDANGNVKGYVNYGGATINANEEANGSVPFTGVTEKIEVYTLETRYQVISPDGTEGEVITDKRSFTVTSTVNDALTKTRLETAAYTSGSDGSSWSSEAGSCGSEYSINFTGKWAFNWTNIYISEVESLTKATEPILSMTDLSSEAHSTGGSWAGYHSTSKAWVYSYGANTYNNDGSITVTSDGGAESIKINDGATDIFNTWFKWAGNDAGGLVDGAVSVPTDRVGQVYTGSTSYDVTGPLFPMWVVETNVSRADFTDDYTVYKIQVPLAANADRTDEVNGTSVVASDRQNVATITQYITLYNSYGLQEKLDAAFAYDEEHYDVNEGAAAWAELQAAIEYANTQMYASWVAANFVANHTINVASLPTGIPQDASGNNYEGYEEATVSTFKYAGDRLEEAMAAMADYALDVEDEVEVIAPSNPSSDLYPVYQALKAIDEKGYSSHNHVGYRWFKFSDDREAIRTALNAATPPTGVANNTLVGVALDNAGINGVVNSITDADVKAIVEALVEAPTQEAIDAAAEALENFEMPAYDVSALMMQVQDMQTNETRLISKYDAQQKYFLNKSIQDYGNVPNDGTYSAGSYANYAAALAAANKANASTTATQYEIFSTRYELQVAYNQLVLAADEVDLEELKLTYAEAKDILDKMNTADAYPVTNAEITEDEAYKQLLLALGYEVTYDEVEYIIGGEYTAEYALSQEGLVTAVKKQNWVNEINANLVAAVANFKATAAPELLVSEYGASMGVVVDTMSFNMNGNGFVYGINTDWGEMIESYFETPAGSVVVTPNEMGAYSTGATIELLDDSGVAVETYHFIFLGDVNGDSFVDAVDVSIVDGIANYVDFDYYGGDGTATSMAMDINGDGFIDAVDVSIIDGIANYVDFPTQADLAAEIAAMKGI